jgi:hypothetical protein
LASSETGIQGANIRRSSKRSLVCGWDTVHWVGVGSLRDSGGVVLSLGFLDCDDCDRGGGALVIGWAGVEFADVVGEDVGYAGWVSLASG